MLGFNLLGDALRDVLDEHDSEAAGPWMKDLQDERERALAALAARNSLY